MSLRVNERVVEDEAGGEAMKSRLMTGLENCGEAARPTCRVADTAADLSWSGKKKPRGCDTTRHELVVG